MAFVESVPFLDRRQRFRPARRHFALTRKAQ